MQVLNSNHTPPAKEDRIGIFSTVPIEIIYAAGLKPVDINNLFISMNNPLKALAVADSFGIPSTVCTWTRGLFGTVILHKIHQVVVVRDGDCTNNRIMTSILQQLGIQVIEFNYPQTKQKRKKQLQEEIQRFESLVKAEQQQLQHVQKELFKVRRLLHRIDELNWKEGLISGSVARRLLLQSTDMKSDYKLFSQEIERTIQQTLRRSSSYNAQPRVAVFGVPTIIRNMHESIEKLGAQIVLSEVEYDFAMIPPTRNLVQQLLRYAYPYGIEKRVRKFLSLLDQRGVELVVVYLQQFCHHNLESRYLLDKLAGTGRKFTVVEGCEPGSLSQQVMARLESLLHTARHVLVTAGLGKNQKRNRCQSHSAKSLIGLDLGSRYAKLIVQHGSEKWKKRFDSVLFYSKFATITADGLRIEVQPLIESVAGSRYRAEFDIPTVVSTGYGRHAAKFTGAITIPEIQAQALGAVSQTGEQNFLLIDVGGQDTKAILIESGKVKEFAMNDRCAAGGGRYVENMAALLRLPLENVIHNYKKPAELSNVCATFGETEIIGKIVQGCAFEQICAGIMRAVAYRTAQLAYKVLGTDQAPQIVYLAGGLAKSRALAIFLAELLHVPKVVPLSDPDYNGAIGCIEFGTRQT